MTNLDIPVALALIVGSVPAYLVWLLVQAAERRARQLCALQRSVGAHSPECVSCRRRIGRIGGTSS